MGAKKVYKKPLTLSKIKKRYKRFFTTDENGKLIKKETLPEKIMKQILLDNGFIFEQEYKIESEFGNKVFDFFVYKEDEYCFLIEVDGDYFHGKLAQEGKRKPLKFQRKNIRNDKIKNNLAKKLGIPLIRFWESDLLKDKEKIIEKLKSMKFKN